MLKLILALSTLILIINSTIIITSPLTTEFPKNELQYMYGNFGQVPYDKTISYDLAILSSSLCGSPNETEHFTKPTYVVIQTTIKQSCSYTKRALNAQARGAKGIIIATPSYDYASGNIFKGDDGNGKKVHITVLFISNSNFLKLQPLKNVEIIAKYPIPKSKIAEVSLFLSASKRSSYLFLRQLQQEYNYLKDYISIEPIYHTVVCQSCNVANCLFSSYCSFDYEEYSYNMGQKIIEEQLRQDAIFKSQGVSKWMEYMNQFDQYCMGDWENAQACSKQIVKKINTDFMMGQPENTIKLWKISQNRLGFDNFPEVAINNMIYRGNFDTDEIIEAICLSLTQPPAYCTTRNTGQIPQEPQNNHTSTLLIVMIVSLIVVIGLVICIYRRFIKRELTNDMASRVGELVANYANSVAKQQKRQRQKLIQENDESL